MVATAVRIADRRENGCELLRPRLFDTQRERVGKQRFEQLRRLIRWIAQVEFIFFRNFHVVRKADNLIENLAPAQCRPTHDDREEHNDEEHENDTADNNRCRSIADIYGHECRQHCGDDGRQVQVAVGPEVLLLVVLLERAAVCTASPAEHCVIIIGQRHHIARGKQRVVELLLTRRQSCNRTGGIQLAQLVFVTRVVNLEVTFHGQVDDGRGHHLVVVVHLADVTQRRRRETVGRLVSRDDDARFRILAVRAPDRDVVDQYEHKADDNRQQVPVVPDQPANTRCQRGLVDKPLRPADDDRQAVRCRQRRVGHEVEIAIVIEEPAVVLRAGTESPRVTVDDELVAGRRKLELHGRRCLVDRERPAVACHVPVKLVVLVEEAEHAVDAVAKCVGMGALVDKAIRAPEIGAHVSATANGMERLTGAIAQHCKRFQPHPVLVAEPVLVVDGKVSIDTAPDLSTLCAHLDRLGNLDHAVSEHADIAVKLEYAFIGRRRQRHEQQQAGQQVSHSTVPNFASGTLATSSEDFWKKSRCVNPNMPATILLGTDSIIVLKSRTEPL